MRQLAETSVSIVGLGLMGGSLAMALKSCAGRLVGVDKDADTCQRAVQLGIVDSATTHLRDGVAEADLVILAIPVKNIMATLDILPELRPDGCMVLDLGSTKGQIGLAMERLPEDYSAIAGHPMCGRESSGLQAATAELYQGQNFILCRNGRTSWHVEQVALQIIEAIGAQPTFMTAEAHDRLVAASSHLPYLISMLLMQRAWAAAQLDNRLWQVSATGLLDTTRLSGSSPQMMLEIVLSNRESILAQLEAYDQELHDLAGWIEEANEMSLRDVFAQAQQHRNDYLEARTATLRSGLVQED